MLSYPTPAGAAGEEHMNPGFVKLHPGAPVHIFTEAADEEFHDHPFDFITHIVAGGYTEEVVVRDATGSHSVATFLRAAGTTHAVTAATIHRITGLPQGFCVTRAEYGETVRKPGFYDLRPEGIYFRYHDEADFRPLPR